MPFLLAGYKIFKNRVSKEYIMHFRPLGCCEYESEYDSEYGGVYDQNFVFYDEEEEEGASYDYDDDFDYEDDYDSDFEDIILEEIPFAYCPSRGETGEA